ncbi:hypothetical protein Pcinc_026998 [Petrolisthes cinctipes]|uniref:Uncharacterized protein n=1 Tax=Petrolisthes cinctipes TaxID=88211 RepID=A0AAE1F6B6_PETCI|nr:hypothetical protein Pcinc_026998 [Petrolisthes cinctipes]
MEWRSTRQRPVARRRKYNVSMLREDNDMREELRVRIGGAFQPLLDMNMNEVNVEDLYQQSKEATNSTTEAVVGTVRGRRTVTLSMEAEGDCERRRKARLEIINNQQIPILRERYKELNKRVKATVRRQKETELEEAIEEI